MFGIIPIKLQHKN